MSGFLSLPANFRQVSCAVVRAIFLVSAYSTLARLGINRDFDAPEPVVCHSE